MHKHHMKSKRKYEIQAKSKSNQARINANPNQTEIYLKSIRNPNLNQTRIKPKSNQNQTKSNQIKPKSKRKTKKSKPAESQPPGIGQRGQPGPLRLAPGDAASLEWPPSPGGRPRTPYGGPCRDPQGTKGAIKQSFLTKKCTGNSLLGRFT